MLIVFGVELINAERLDESFRSFRDTFCPARLAIAFYIILTVYIEGKVSI